LLDQKKKKTLLLKLTKTRKIYRLETVECSAASAKSSMNDVVIIHHIAKKEQRYIYIFFPLQFQPINGQIYN